MAGGGGILQLFGASGEAQDPPCTVTVLSGSLWPTSQRLIQAHFPISTAILGWASPTLHLDNPSGLLPGACLAPLSPLPLSSLPPVSSPAPPLSATPVPGSFVFQPHPPSRPTPSHTRTHSFMQVSPLPRSPSSSSLPGKQFLQRIQAAFPLTSTWKSLLCALTTAPGLASIHLTLHNPHEPGKDLIWCTSGSPVQAQGLAHCSSRFFSAQKPTSHE